MKFHCSCLEQEASEMLQGRWGGGGGQVPFIRIGFPLFFSLAREHRTI